MCDNSLAVICLECYLSFIKIICSWHIFEPTFYTSWFRTELGNPMSDNFNVGKILFFGPIQKVCLLSQFVMPIVLLLFSGNWISLPWLWLGLDENFAGCRSKFCHSLESTLQREILQLQPKVNLLDDLKCCCRDEETREIDWITAFCHLSIHLLITGYMKLSHRYCVNAFTSFVSLKQFFAESIILQIYCKSVSEFLQIWIWVLCLTTNGYSGLLALFILIRYTDTNWKSNQNAVWWYYSWLQKFRYPMSPNN